jgi:hypothetical protein
MFRVIQTGFLVLLVGAVLHAEVLQVRHDHDPWGKCIGELEINNAGIEFRSNKEKHSRHWDWLEIQSFTHDTGTGWRSRVLTASPTRNSRFSPGKIRS